MKKSILFLISVIFIFTLFPDMKANASYNSLLPNLKLNSEIVMLQSLDDGSIIFDKKIDEKCAPASLTKIITGILVLKNCKDLNEIVTVPEYTIRMFDGLNSSNAGIKPGEKMSVLDLLYCLLVQSANEAAAILADYTSGTIEEFVTEMNELAMELGCTNTVFKNPHGLDEEGHYTTARDISKMVSYALDENFSKSDIFEKIVTTQRYKVNKTNLSRERILVNTNGLMNKGIPDYYYEYAKGIKTGTTNDAGRCVVSMAEKDGYSFLCIIMKAPMKNVDNDTALENCSFIDCKTVFKWAFENIRLKNVTKTDQIICTVDVDLAWDVDHVALVPEKDFSALVPIGIDDGSVLVKVIDKSLTKDLAAPVTKGQVIGQASVLYADEEIAKINLVAEKSIKRSTILYSWSLVKKMSGTFPFKLIVTLFVILVIGYISLNVYINNKKKQKYKLKVMTYRDVDTDKKKRKY